MKILLVGGGTGGSVSPLLAVRHYITTIHPKAQFILVGTARGPEREMAESEGIDYFSIPAGKWRRYLSLKNISDLAITFFGFIKAFFLLRRLRPNVIFAAGSFVSVPVAYAAYLLRIKILIHQQDVLPSLSNKIIYPVASRVTVSLETSEKDFTASSGLFRPRKRSKVFFTGNPVREDITRGEAREARELFNLRSDFPTLLILGGSTGAKNLNLIIERALPELTKYFQIIHLTGKDKLKDLADSTNYHVMEFVPPYVMPHLLKAADIVVSRAGFSTITELAACKKVSIIVPLPNSHQVFNAHYLLWKKAAIIAPEHLLTTENLIYNLRKLLFDRDTQNSLSRSIGLIMPRDGARRVSEVLLELIEKKK